MRKILSLRGYSVSFGRKLVLSDISFDLGETGITHLMGPCGSGKSTLLRSLAGLNQRASIFSSKGEVFYLGEPLGDREYPAIVEQKPSGLTISLLESMVSQMPDRSSLQQRQQLDLVKRLFDLYGLSELEDLLSQPLMRLPLAQRRLAAILGQVIGAPALLLLDEPTANLDEADAKRVLDLISRVSENRAVLLIQHNQKLALALGGSTLLLAGGVIQESDATAKVLTEPQSEAGKEFKGTGTCAAPSPDTDPAYLDEAFVEKYQPKAKPVSPLPEVIPFGPRGFKWIDRSCLAATPRPGLLNAQAYDLKALAKAGINRLVSLEESETVSSDSAAEVGIKIRHLPVVDMQSPSYEEAMGLVKEMDNWIGLGEKVAVHCKAGLGRTGTIIAAYYVYKGMKPKKALATVRCVDPRMVQSDSQERFIRKFFFNLSIANSEYSDVD